MHRPVRLYFAGAGGSLAGAVSEPELFTIAAGGRDHQQRLGVDRGSAMGYRQDERMQ
jgi:hypothetical protein